MMKLINEDTVLKIKCLLESKIKFLYQWARPYFNKRYFIALLSVFLFSFFILILFFGFHNSYKHNELQNNYAVRFEAPEIKIQKQPSNIQPLNIVSDKKSDEKILQNQLNQLKQSSSKKMQALQVELQIMQSRISLLASKNDVQKLQETVSEPNSTLLGKMNNLQDSVQKVIAQTAEKTWVDPSTVQKYFRLVAVQGFSDGMRAIIDIDGNQTTLTANEICPACRGWVLQKMSFSNQSAVFSKQTDSHTFYVKLQGN